MMLNLLNYRLWSGLASVVLAILLAHQISVHQSSEAQDTPHFDDCKSLSRLLDEATRSRDGSHQASSFVSRGGNKEVFRVEGFAVSVCRCSPAGVPWESSSLHDRRLRDDCNHGIEMKRLFSRRSKAFVPLLGACNDTAYVSVPVSISPFYEDGTALEFLERTPHLSFSGRANITLDYLWALTELHQRLPDSPYVFCDSNTPHKILSQFLMVVERRHTKIVRLNALLNDLDALPSARAHPVRCGHQSLAHLKTVAPEQRLSTASTTEKSDIWKIPQVVRLIFAPILIEPNVHPGYIECIGRLLERLDSLCLSTVPNERANAHTVFTEAKRILT